MFDLIALFFSAIRYSVRAISNPSPIPRHRMQERLILAFTVSGTVVFVAAIYALFTLNVRGATWFIVLFAGPVCWCVAACIGQSIKTSLEDRNQLMHKGS